MNHTTVVFIDGPNAVGKTYFTDHFKEEYLKRNPDAVIHNYDASKYTYWKNRKERVHHTDAYNLEELQNIFLGHLELIHDIKHDAAANKPNLIIVNRSINSFLTYNLRYDHLPAASEERKELERLTKLYKDIYENYFIVSLYNVKTIYVGLTIFNSGPSIARQRLEERDYVKKVDSEHLIHLFTTYTDLASENRSLYTRTELVESDAYIQILDKHIK